jgi:hypothetical protein
MVITGGLMLGIAENAAESRDASQMEVTKAMAVDTLKTFGLM